MYQLMEKSRLRDGTEPVVSPSSPEVATQHDVSLLHYAGEIVFELLASARAGF